MMNFIFQHIGPVIREKHMNPVVAACARLCERYLYFYRNEKHWNMENNGESLLLHTLRKNISPDKPLIVFDVGANRGTYTRQICRILPQAMIHSFEIVPKTRQILAANLSDFPNVIIPDYGLSDRETELQIGYHPHYDDHARELSPFSEHVEEVIACKVIKGDTYLSTHQIENVTLLKIDVEGHEMAILEGFRESAQNGKIGIIQFEYGTTWIAPRRFMHEAYTFLEPAGYFIGRLHPDGILFKPYSRLTDDRFYMGNYVAVHQTYWPMIKCLNLNRKGLSGTKREECRSHAA